MSITIRHKTHGAMKAENVVINIVDLNSKQYLEADGSPVCIELEASQWDMLNQHANSLGMPIEDFIVKIVQDYIVQ